MAGRGTLHPEQVLRQGVHDVLPGRSGRNAAQDQEDEKARRASIEKWEAFCKPKRTYDDEGVVRLVYARKGCEFGRSE